MLSIISGLDRLRLDIISTYSSTFLTCSLGLNFFSLPEETLVYPGHDYNGKFSSTIGNEKKFNPRLQVKSVDGYVEIMSNLNLSKPEMMDSNVGKNIRLGAN